MKFYKDLLETPYCRKSEVLYLVKTARTNFGLRELLRSKQSNWTKNMKTQMLFLIGSDSIETKLKKEIIENEIQEFGDFIIGDYFDSYNNLTKKVCFHKRFKHSREYWGYCLSERDFHVH